MNNKTKTISSADIAPVAKGWQAALAMLAFCEAWLLIWYRGTAESMVGIWARSDTFMHGFLILPIVLWLVWRQKDALAKYSPRPNPWLLIPLVVVGFAWLLGELASINAVTQLALVMFMVLLVPAVLGMPVARAITFPLMFMFFAVPIGEFFMPQLMEWTAHFTVLALRLSGIPVYQEGLQFVIPSGSWSVVEACSGIRYLIASLTVGTLFAYLNYVSFKRRAIFIVISFLVPIVANWMRAYIIVMLGHLSSGKLAAGVDHLIYGWVFFGLVILIMFMIGARWAEDPVDAVPGEATGPVASASAVSRSAGWLPVVLIAMVSALPVLAFQAIESGTTAIPPQLVFPPAATQGLDGWQVDDSKPQSDADWQPSFVNPSAELQKMFVHDGRTVGIYLAYYRKQDYSRKLISSENMLVKYKDKNWAQVASGSRELIMNGQPVVVRTAELRGASLMAGSDETRLIAWEWFWINGQLTASDHRAKVYTAFSRLMGQGDDSAAIIVYAPKYQPGGGEAALAAFVAAAGGQIEEALRQTRERP